MPIHIRFDRSDLASSRAALQRFARELLQLCLDDLQWQDAELTVLFCSTARIRRLNNDHRGFDKETDVLSFPAVDDAESIRGEEAPYLGDLALSLRVCERQARKPLDEEVALLLVHGLLHLLGHDHDTPAKKKRMWAETARLLRLARRIPRPGIVLKKET